MAVDKDEVSPRGDIPKHIMDGIVSEFEDKKKEIKRESLMDVTIDDVTPKIRRPSSKPVKKHNFEFKAKTSEEKEEKTAGVVQKDTTRIELVSSVNKDEVKEPVPKVMPYGGDYPKHPKTSTLTEKKLETIQKILDMGGNDQEVAAAIIPDKQKTEEKPKAEFHPDIHIVASEGESKSAGEVKSEAEEKKEKTKPDEKQDKGNKGFLGRLFPKIDFHKIAPAMPYVGLLVLVILIISSMSQFNNMTGNIAASEPEEDHEIVAEEDIHKSEEQYLDEKIIDEESIIGINSAMENFRKKLTNFFKKNILNNLGEEPETEGHIKSVKEHAEGIEGHVGDVDKTNSDKKEPEEPHKTSEDEGDTDGITSEEVMSYLKSKMLSKISEKINEST